MTISDSTGSQVEVAVDLITVTIDGVQVRVPKGTLAIRAAELLGIEVPRFCDHPLLDPVAACRACLIEVEGMPKPQPACAQALGDGMAIHTQYSSEVARIAQEGVIEFLLINHPLDCPMCDKGGECPLQNYTMAVGRPETRFIDEKRHFEKPVNISAQILLDRERCISCARCTRFADEIAGEALIQLVSRGARQQVATADDVPFDSYFSGNVIQICPVGALTSETYRFQSRPFDLVSVPTTCEHCAAGCSLRTDYRRGAVTRRLAWDDPDVNEEWNCDKGRFAFPYLVNGRISNPLVREDGELRPASWPEAIDVAARGLSAARGSVGVLIGGRSTLEDAYAYARFARVALGSDDIDFRSRVSSAEESQFLSAVVAGRGTEVTFADVEAAPTVLLVCLEPADEDPILQLRLRKAVRKRGMRVLSVGAVATADLARVGGSLVGAVPGHEAEAIASLDPDVRAALAEAGSVILVGERAAGSAGTLTALRELSRETGARLAWVPRRAGERAALDAGALAGLLPGGRPLADPQARAQVAAAWGVDAASLPTVGRSGDDLLRALAAGSLGALLVGGVGLEDYPDPLLAAAAVEKAGFVVSLEHHHSAVTAQADVVLPVALVTEKAGTFVNWEGRHRPFGQVFRDALAMPDARVLSMLAAAMEVSQPADVRAVRAEIAALGEWSGVRSADATGPVRSTADSAAPASGVVLATWRQLLDDGVMQDGEPFLAATARPTVARMSAVTASGLGDTVTVSGPRGSVTVPVEIADVVDDVVWLPANSPGCHVYADLGAAAGDTVQLAPGGAA